MCHVRQQHGMWSSDLTTVVTTVFSRHVWTQFDTRQTVRDHASTSESTNIAELTFYDSLEQFVIIYRCLSDSSGRSSPEIDRHIGLASSPMARLSTVWRQVKVSLNTKLRLYNAWILSVLLYGCETWTLFKADERKLEAFHVSCQRQILGIRWYHFVSNASVINQTGQDSLCSRIRSRRLAVFGLVRQLAKDVPAHRSLSVAVKVTSGRQPAHWRRSRGRPHHSWTTQIESDSGHCADLA